MFDNLNNTIGFEDSIMHYLRVPSVAVLYAVTVYSISRHILPHKDTITNNNGVVGVGNDISRTDSTSGNVRIKASATREGKEYCSQTQYQGESQ